MNRLLISATVVLAVAVGMMLNMQVLSAQRAGVVKDIGSPCGIFVGSVEEGTSAGGEGVITMLLENTDKVMMKCKGTGLENLTGVAQSAEGFLCGIVTPEGLVLETEDTRATVSASGVGTMTCTYHK